MAKNDKKPGIPELQQELPASPLFNPLAGRQLRACNAEINQLLSSMSPARAKKARKALKSRIDAINKQRETVTRRNLALVLAGVLSLAGGVGMRGDHGKSAPINSGNNTDSNVAQASSPEEDIDIPPVVLQHFEVSSGGDTAEWQQNDYTMQYPISFPENAKVALPSITDQTGTFATGSIVPEGLALDDVQGLAQLVKEQGLPALSESYEECARLDTYPQADQRNIDRMKMKATEDFLQWVMGRIKSAPNDLGPDFKRFLETQKGNIDLHALIRKINTYLIPAGLYIDPVNGNYGLQVYSIDPDNTQVIVLDYNGVAVKVPFLFTQTSLLPDLRDKDAQLWHVGQFFPDGGYSVIITDEMNAEAQEQHSIAGRYGVSLDGLTEEQLKTKNSDSVLRHEATHALLDKLFPQLKTRQDDFLPVSLTFRIGKVKAELPPQATPTMLHEVCAMGVQINAMKGKQVLVLLLDTIRNYRDAGAITYSLVGDITPLLALQHLPDSPEKDAILRKFLTSGGQLDNEAVRKLVARDCTEDTARGIGASMFRIGFEQLSTQNQLAMR